MQVTKFSLLRQKKADIRSRPLVGCLSVLAVTATLAAIAFCLLLADPIVMNECRQLPRWCAEVGQFLNRFGNGYNIFLPLGIAILVLTCTIRMKLSRAAHIAITAIAVRLIFLLTAIGIPSIVSVFAKWVFGRIRPKLSQKAGTLDFNFFTWTYDGIGLSFPSGHTTVAFSAAFALSTLVPQARIPLFALAGLVGAARIVLGAHYLSDVIAGALCGIVFASLVSRAFARQRLGLVVTAEGKIEPKPWPRLRHLAALAGAPWSALRPRPPASVLVQTGRST